MSIKPNPVVWFEIPVSNIARAKTFYESAFGGELTQTEMGPSKMAWFPMEMGAAGSAGTLIQADSYTPSHHGSLVYIGVSKIDAALARIGEAGGKTLMPRTSIGQHGFIAYFEDCEGNRVALHEAPAG
jgi:predicted enzyme related to lactoylglutathione lyase